MYACFEVVTVSEIAKKLGERIRRIRKQNGMSQELLGELSGLHTNYIGQVERGEKNLTVESLQKIAEGLHTPLEQLFRNIEHVPSLDELDKLIALLEERSLHDKRFALQLLQSVFSWEEIKNNR